MLTSVIKDVFLVQSSIKISTGFLCFQVMFFSSDIFNDAGLTGLHASYATMAIGAVNVIMTVVSLFLVEKAGRKTLLLVGFGGMAIVTLLLTIALLYSVST